MSLATERTSSAIKQKYRKLGKKKHIYFEMKSSR